MKRLITVLTSILFLAVLFVATNVNMANAAEDKVINLKYATDVVPFGKAWQNVKNWAKEAETLTNGRMKIALFPLGQLVKGDQIRKSTLRGLADIGALNIGLDLSAYRLNSVMELPFTGFANEKTATRIWKEIVEKFPEAKAEFKGTKILWQTVQLPHYIHSTKKPVKIPDDLKGVKVSAMGLNLKVLDALGASPISLMPQEAYLGLERGVAEGAMAPYLPMEMLRLVKLLHYHNMTVLNYNTFFAIMNLKKWNSLPDDIRKIFGKLCEEHGKKALEIDIVLEQKSLERTKKMEGHKFIENTPAEIAMWEELAKPYNEKWVTDNEKRGLPARKVYNEVRRLAKEYKD